MPSPSQEQTLIAQVDRVFNYAIGPNGPYDSVTNAEAHRVFKSVQRLSVQSTLAVTAQQALYPWILTDDRTEVDPVHFHDYLSAMNRWYVGTGRLVALNKLYDEIALNTYLYYRGETPGAEAPHSPELYVKVISSIGSR